MNTDVIRGPHLLDNNPVRLHHKVQTMKLMKEELKSGSKTSLDEVILAVLTLGSNEVETVAKVAETTKSPFNSPLSLGASGSMYTGAYLMSLSIPLP